MTVAHAAERIADDDPFGTPEEALAREQRLAELAELLEETDWRQPWRPANGPAERQQPGKGEANANRHQTSLISR